MKFGILLIRLMLGIVFIVHGGQKVLGGFSEPMAM
ncbi:DoxX family membrane protein, partial [Bacillus subtilis]